MKPTIALPIVFASLVAAPTLAPADVLPPAPPSASAASAPATGDAGADAGASPRLDELGAFALEPPKEEKTPPPKPKEWTEAEETTLARGSSDCRVFRVREWIKLNCTTIFGVRADLVSGNGKDVYFFLREGIDCEESNHMTYCSTVTDIVFPLRRGDRRAIQIASRSGGYTAPGMSPYNASIFISETWVEDDPGPIVTIENVF